MSRRNQSSKQKNAAKKKKKKKKKAATPSGGATLASKADKYKLYEEAVQEPEADLRFVQRIFRNRFGRPARTLREDFCGTSALACEWVSQHRENRAWGIDIDPEPLNWGRENNVSLLTDSQRSRLDLIQGDVLDTTHELVDLTLGFNFSYFLFKQRSELLGYFRHARSTLRPEGILVLDAYGGPEAQQTMEEPREYDGFDYVWDQDEFDPIHHGVVNYIHFDFPDGSRLRKAFRYDWRLWTLPELSDLLMEAGFSETEVYWEGVEKDTGEGNGVYRKADKALDDPAWIAYIVGIV